VTKTYSLTFASSLTADTSLKRGKVGLPNVQNSKLAARERCLCLGHLQDLQHISDRGQELDQGVLLPHRINGGRPDDEGITRSDFKRHRDTILNARPGNLRGSVVHIYPADRYEYLDDPRPKDGTRILKNTEKQRVNTRCSM